MKNVMIRNDKGIMISVAESIVKNWMDVEAAEANGWKIYEAGKVPFEVLPEFVQSEVMDTLKAYAKVNVYYANASYHVSAGCFIAATYPMDECTCGTYYAKDIYTEEERRANFIEVFGYDPKH